MTPDPRLMQADKLIIQLLLWELELKLFSPASSLIASVFSTCILPQTSLLDQRDTLKVVELRPNKSFFWVKACFKSFLLQVYSQNMRQVLKRSNWACCTCFYLGFDPPVLKFWGFWGFGYSQIRGNSKGPHPCYRTELTLCTKAFKSCYYNCF